MFVEKRQDGIRLHFRRYPSVGPDGKQIPSLREDGVDLKEEQAELVPPVGEPYSPFVDPSSSLFSERTLEDLKALRDKREKHVAIVRKTKRKSSAKKKSKASSKKPRASRMKILQSSSHLTKEQQQQLLKALGVS